MAAHLGGEPYVPPVLLKVSTRRWWSNQDSTAGRSGIGKTTDPRRQFAGGDRSAPALGLPGLRLRSSGESSIWETTGSTRQRGATRVGSVCACAARAGPLGRSGHHLGTGGGAEPTGSDRAGRRCRHEPRIVSEPRPRRVAQPRSCLWGYTLIEAVWPWSELRGAPTSGSLFR